MFEAGDLDLTGNAELLEASLPDLILMKEEVSSFDSLLW